MGSGPVQKGLSAVLSCSKKINPTENELLTGTPDGLDFRVKSSKKAQQINDLLRSFLHRNKIKDDGLTFCYPSASISASTTKRLILRVVVLGNSMSRRVNRLILL